MAEEEELLAGEETYDFHESTSGDETDPSGIGWSKNTDEGGKTVEEALAQLGEGLEGEDLSGSSLFRCGNKPCRFSCAAQAAFRRHISSCEYGQTNLSCYHCGRQHKHAPTLLDHLVKAHGPKRYGCSLCGAKASTQQAVRGHMKTAHMVGSSAKVVPLDSSHSDPESDRFLLVPKNAMLRSVQSLIPSSSSSKAASNGKDTFALHEAEALPHSWVSRQPLRCSECEFGTRVRKNLEKHLKLHIRRNAEATKQCQEENVGSNLNNDKPIVPVITPINAPTVNDPKSDKATKMSNLLDCDSEQYTRPMRDEDMAAMPALVEESLR